MGNLLHIRRDSFPLFAFATVPLTRVLHTYMYTRWYVREPFGRTTRRRFVHAKGNVERHLPKGFSQETTSFLFAFSTSTKKRNSSVRSRAWIFVNREDRSLQTTPPCSRIRVGFIYLVVPVTQGRRAYFLRRDTPTPYPRECSRSTRIYHESFVPSFMSRYKCMLPLLRRVTIDRSSRPIPIPIPSHPIPFYPAPLILAKSDRAHVIRNLSTLRIL